MLFLFKYRNCKNLQYLSLAFCVKLTEKGFAYLLSGEGLKNLVYIDLSGCNQVSQHFVLFIKLIEF